MIKKFGKIFIGIIIGVVFVSLVWYLIQGWNAAPNAGAGVPIIKDDLMSNSAIDEAKSKASVIDYPITVKSRDMGQANPF